MRANEFTTKKEQQVDEILPVLGAVASGVGRAALAGGQMLARGAQAAGSAALKGAQAAGSAISKGAQAAGQAANMIDPAVVAQQELALKKQTQDEIKQKQDELLLLKQQLAKMV